MKVRPRIISSISPAGVTQVLVGGFTASATFVATLRKIGIPKGKAGLCVGNEGRSPIQGLAIEV